MQHSKNKKITLPNPSEIPLQADEDYINSVINKGARLPEDDSRDNNKNNRLFTLKIPVDLVEKLDELKKKNHYTFSRNSLIVQAIIKYLDSEDKSLKT